MLLGPLVVLRAFSGFNGDPHLPSAQYPCQQISQYLGGGHVKTGFVRNGKQRPILLHLLRCLKQKQGLTKQNVTRK